MKVHELITRLQNFDMELDVKCLMESTEWGYDDEAEQSVEINTVVEAHVNEVKLVQYDKFTNYVLIK